MTVSTHDGDLSTLANIAAQWLISHQSAIVGNTVRSPVPKPFGTELTLAFQKAAWAIDAVYARKYPSIIADPDVRPLKLLDRPES